MTTQEYTPRAAYIRKLSARTSGATHRLLLTRFYPRSDYVYFFTLQRAWTEWREPSPVMYAEPHDPWGSTGAGITLGEIERKTEMAQQRARCTPVEL
jgi:hypothetical protein